MNIIEFYLLIPIILIAFLIRIYLIYKYKWVGKDSFYNFIVAREIRSKRKIPKQINIFIIPEKYDYPPFLHVMLALFDEKYYNKLQYLSPIIDIITGTFIFIVCLFIFNIEIAFITITLYFFTPIIYDISFALTPRTFANLFLVLSLLSLYLYYINNIAIILLAHIIFTTLVLLTHRLTTQSLVFILIALSVYKCSLLPIVILLICIILALIATKGFYIQVLKGHINFIKIFVKKISIKSTRKEMKNIFPNPLYVLFNLPIIIIIPFSMYYLYSTNVNDALFFIIWSLALILLSLIWILGEGIRHITNAIPAFAIITAIYIVITNNHIIYLAILSLSVLFLIIKVYRIEKIPSLGNFTTQDMIDGFNYIKTHKKCDDVTLCLPLDFSYNAAYFTECTILQSSGGFANGLNFNQHLHKFINERRIEELVLKYKIRWIIVLVDDNYKIQGEIKFKKGDVTVYKINN